MIKSKAARRLRVRLREQDGGDSGDDADPGHGGAADAAGDSDHVAVGAVQPVDQTTESPVERGAGAGAGSPARRVVVRRPGKQTGVEAGSADAEFVVCGVCGERGHAAGFIDNKYVDCPNRACFLCKREGHTTQTCPFRLRPGDDALTTADDASGAAAARDGASPQLLKTLRQRGLLGTRPGVRRLHVPARVLTRTWGAAAAMLQQHTRRVTVAEWHMPVERATGQRLLVSGDKSGEVAVWKLGEGDGAGESDCFSPHMWLITGIVPTRFAPSAAFTVSVDGALRLTHLSEQSTTLVARLNAPGADHNDPKTWRSFYSVAGRGPGGAAGGVLVAGDDIGRLHVIDARVDGGIVASYGAHKRNKVTCVDICCADDSLVVTSGNDHVVKLWDLRKMGKGGKAAPTAAGAAAQKAAMATPLAVADHPRVVNSAYFSPLTGRKIATTCIDNRIRVWDSIHGFSASNGTPDRTLVHSHDFSRYLTPFRARWDPTDPRERLIVCGRYISEDFGGDMGKLHPVDVLDPYLPAVTGLVVQLADKMVTTICPVNTPHPTEALIASGTSRNLFVWRPLHDDEIGENGAPGERAEAGAGAGDGEGSVSSGAARGRRRGRGRGHGRNSGAAAKAKKKAGTAASKAKRKKATGAETPTAKGRGAGRDKKKGKASPPAAVAGSGASAGGAKKAAKNNGTRKRRAETSSSEDSSDAFEPPPQRKPRQRPRRVASSGASGAPMGDGGGTGAGAGAGGTDDTDDDGAAVAGASRARRGRATRAATSSIYFEGADSSFDDNSDSDFEDEA